MPELTVLHVPFDPLNASSLPAAVHALAREMEPEHRYRIVKERGFDIVHYRWEYRLIVIPSGVERWRAKEHATG